MGSWGVRKFWIGSGEKLTAIEWSLTSSFPPHSFLLLLVLRDSSSLVKVTKDPHIANFNGQFRPNLTWATSRIYRADHCLLPGKYSPLFFLFTRPSFFLWLLLISQLLKIGMSWGSVFRTLSFSLYPQYPQYRGIAPCFTELNTVPHAHYTQDFIFSPDFSPEF